MAVQKQENYVRSVDVGSIAFFALSFALFMMGAAFILASEAIGGYITERAAYEPTHSIAAVLIALVVSVIVLIITTFGAYFNSDRETHGILLGFVVTLLVGVVMLIVAYVFAMKNSIEGGNPFFGGDFSLPCYIAALFMLICGILLFFKKGKFKLIGVTYVLGALMYVFFARAIQALSSLDLHGPFPAGPSRIPDLASLQTPLVVAGVFAIVAGILAVYIAISKTNTVKAPLV